MLLEHAALDEHYQVLEDTAKGRHALLDFFSFEDFESFFRRIQAKRDNHFVQSRINQFKNTLDHLINHQSLVDSIKSNNI